MLRQIGTDCSLKAVDGRTHSDLASKSKHTVAFSLLTLKTTNTIKYKVIVRQRQEFFETHASRQNHPSRLAINSQMGELLASAGAFSLGVVRGVAWGSEVIRRLGR